MTTEELIKDNMALIKHIAQNFYQVSFEDLLQAGAMGILKAYKKFPQHIDLKDISILNDPQTNAPYILCSKLNDKLEISITHTDNYSMAVVILHP